MFAVIVVQGVVIAALLKLPPNASVAEAQGIPDAGAQRQQMLEELRAVNGRVDRLTSLLTTGGLKVTVIKGDASGARP